jgi:hypothetical protein
VGRTSGGRALTGTERAALDGRCATNDCARALLDAAIERVPIPGHDGKSGAQLERVLLADGQRLIAKHLSPATDLTMLLTGDTTGREFALWRDGVLDRLPAGVGHALAAAWAEPRGATLLLRDVSADLAPEWISRDQCRRIFAAAAALHTAFAGADVAAACPLEIQLTAFAPQRMLARSATDHGLPPLVRRGWEVFADVAPAAVADAVFAVHDKPAPLAERLAAGGTTLLHGDLWLANVALEADQVTLLDWALATCGPPALDFVYFLTGNASRVDASADELLDDVRVACGDRHDEDTLRLALLAGLVELGWNKALDAVEHRDPAIRAREVDDLAWWVHEARTTLDAGLLP